MLTTTSIPKQPPERPNLARILTLSLGALWLADGILQLQPAMFTSGFVSQVLAPTLTGQPSSIAALVAFGIRIASGNPFWFNVGAAAIQLLIGALLIFPLVKQKNAAGNRQSRFALSLSVLWGLIIWIFGEGFGMLATGTATFFNGAPGSALLYVILALFLLYSRDKLEKLPVVAGIIFLLGAALSIIPPFSILSFGALAALGILLILFPRSRSVAWIACIFLIAVWWMSQSFGGILTFPSGTATDPNSAIVLVFAAGDNLIP